ncbi:MAG: tetratricopeptide repeat protein [Myxococcota bacterium]
MATDKQRLEQIALQQLRRGELEKALGSYKRVLKADPRDRRIRMAVADLYIRLNEHQVAEKHYRYVAESLRKDGQDRAAIPVYQQLIKLNRADPELLERLGDSYLAADQEPEARQRYAQAAEIAERSRPDLAQGILDKLIKMSPGDTPLKVRRAELLEAANWSEKASDAWKDLAQESLRLGRPDDQARFLERALDLREEPDVLLTAAEARLKMNDPRRALKHLRAGRVPQPSGKFVAVLAEAVQAVGRTAEAGQLWTEAARRFGQEGLIEQQAAALRSAGRFVALNQAQSAILTALDQTIAQRKLRLDALSWAQPVNDRQAEVIVRAQVQVEYGFPQRARRTLLRAKDVRNDLPIQALLVEVIADTSPRSALRELSRIVPPDDNAREQIELRARLLRAGQPSANGDPPSETEAELDAEELVEGGEPVDDADMLFTIGATDEDDDDFIFPDEDDEEAPSFLDMPTNPGGHPPQPDPMPSAGTPAASPHEQRGDELAEMGDIASAIAAYREALNARPDDDGLLMKIGELIAARASASAPKPPPPPEPFAESGGVSFQDAFDSGGVFGEFSFDDLGEEPEPEPEPAELPEVIALREARGWVSVGMYTEAAALLKGRTDVPALVLAARIRLEIGNLREARDAVRQAIKGVPPKGETYLEALWILCEIYTRAKKPTAALKWVDEIQSADPTWRGGQLADRRAGLELMARDEL